MRLQRFHRHPGNTLKRPGNSRELQRNKGNHRPYRPSGAQNRYHRQRKHCGRKPILADPILAQKVRTYIEEFHWSPEQIEHRLELENSDFRISYATIYRGIWAGRFDPKANAHAASGATMNKSLSSPKLYKM